MPGVAPSTDYRRNGQVAATGYSSTTSEQLELFRVECAALGEGILLFLKCEKQAGFHDSGFTHGSFQIFYLEVE
jgi:hypothetical protein